MAACQNSLVALFSWFPAMRQNMRPQLKSTFLGMLDKARYMHDAEIKLSDQHVIKLKATKMKEAIGTFPKHATFKAITLRS